jgi:hypothetical protein
MKKIVLTCTILVVSFSFIIGHAKASTRTTLTQLTTQLASSDCETDSKSDCVSSDGNIYVGQKKKSGGGASVDPIF